MLRVREVYLGCRLRHYKKAWCSKTLHALTLCLGSRDNTLQHDDLADRFFGVSADAFQSHGVEFWMHSKAFELNLELQHSLGEVLVKLKSFTRLQPNQTMHEKRVIVIPCTSYLIGC